MRIQVKREVSDIWGIRPFFATPGMASANVCLPWLTGNLTGSTVLNPVAQQHRWSGPDQARCRYSSVTCSGRGTKENPLSDIRRCQPSPATSQSRAAVRLSVSESPVRHVAFCAASTSDAETSAKETTKVGTDEDNVELNPDTSRKARLVRTGALEGGKRAARKGGLPTPKEVWSRRRDGAKVTRNFSVLRVAEEGNAELDSAGELRRRLVQGRSSV